MDDSAKYLIHAQITADGVVERSDVVGAVFGQTEGLLGDELDLRDLQQSSKVGRIDVRIDSENGQSFGEITIASGLDKAETAILAASLEAITRVGPCEARVEVTDIEDTRAAQRREVVERAKELLADSFDETVMDSGEILDEVREANRVERIDEYEGLPAGPRVRDSDAVVVVEGRADVLALLKYGIKNGVAVEGTNVPGAVAELTGERTVTAFLDGDRGGELILRELAQVGDIDYAAFAPEGRSVEDLSRHELMAALREKAPFESIDPGDDGGANGRQSPVDGGSRAGDGTASADAAVAATDGSAEPAPDQGSATADAPATPPTTESPGREPDAAGPVDDADGAVGADATADAGGDPTGSDGRTDAQEAGTSEEPTSLREHVGAVIVEGSNRARLLDADCRVIAELPAADVFDGLSRVDETPVALVLDGELSQRVLDVAAQRGVGQVVAGSEGEYVNRPASVRVVTADRLLSA